MTEEQKVSVPEAATTEQAPVVAEVKVENKSPEAEKAVEAAPAAEVKPAVEVKPEPAKEEEKKTEAVKEAEEVEPVKEAEKPVEPVKEAEKSVEPVKEAETVDTIKEEPVKTEENNEDSILSAGDDEVKKIIDGLNDSLEDDDDAIMLDTTEGENGEPVPENPPTSLRNVKIARIPKEVFDFMVKDEGEEGTVRINLTQMRYFLQEELWKLAKYVNGSVWDKCEFPVLDMLVPSNASQHLTVQTFNTLKIADEEKRITKELEKIQKIEANQYKKMSPQHKKKVWADLEKKFTVKDNLIQRVGLHPVSPKKAHAGQAKANSQTTKKAEQSDVPSQIQPAVPVEGAAVTPATKATPAAQNGANKSDNARKRPVQSSGAAGDSTPVPTKRNRSHDNGNKNQGQKSQGGFPKKNNGNNGSNKFNNGSNRFNNQNNRRNDRRNNFEGTQPWSKPIQQMNNFGYNSSFRTPAAPAISAFTPTPSPYESLAERERSLIERERRLLSVAAENQFQSSYSSAYGSSSSAPTSDYRTTYDNYANSSAFGSSGGSTGSSYPSSGGYSSFTGSSAFGGADSGSSFSTGGGYGGGSNFATSNNTYGSFLSSYGDNTQNQSRGRAGRKMGGGGRR